ncbi:hypothetical protein BLNAU_19344 [Blattamonas nauphoetae]|uniref:Uncharacterized protein n=1 Tax=Blattamonas nauphoetae TaxID=2049346 RepID=A0ABQ9X510_9EUKA|nr:hypothetical protein BLNAU_19344 [Blattamonas nauphoetae]
MTLRQPSQQKQTFLHPSRVPSLANSIQLSSSNSTNLQCTPSAISLSHTSEPSLASSVQHSISIATNLQSTPSEASLSHSSFIHQATLNIITTIHTILSAPSQISSFPQFRLSSTFELDLLRFGQQHFDECSPDLDLTETFSPDLFDEEDDFVLVTTLWRCEAVLTETNSSSCILHQAEFIPKLVSALHSDNSLIRDRSGALFGSLVLLVDCPDPLSPPYSSLRDAFREGTETEQSALLQLWILWMHKESRKTSHDRKMKESDFDFDGFLSVHLSNCRYFIVFLRFVMCLINADLNKTSSWMEMSLDWRINFLLRFHKSNDLMSAIAVPDVCYYACMLSHFHGIPFPTALLDFIENTTDFPEFSVFRGLHPTVFLSHTSLPHSSRRSHVPYDILFERHLRLDSSDLVICRRLVHSIKSKWILNTPLIGIHSLLLRGFHLDFSDDEKRELGASIIMAFHTSQYPRQPGIDIFFALFSDFPPPLVIPSIVMSINTTLKVTSFMTEFLIILQSLLLHTAPFGDCVSLSKILPAIVPLLPFSKIDKNIEISFARTIFVLSWLNLPPHFDLPLLSLNPSHSTHSEILSTFTKNSRQVMFDEKEAGRLRVLFLLTQIIQSLHRENVCACSHIHPFGDASSIRCADQPVLMDSVGLSLAIHHFPTRFVIKVKKKSGEDGECRGGYNSCGSFDVASGVIKYEPSSTANSEIGNAHSDLCSWSTGTIELVNSTAVLKSCSLTNLAQGAIIQRGGNVTLRDVYFLSNGPTNRDFPSARRNVMCSSDGTLFVGGLTGDGRSHEFPGSGISGDGCSVSGTATTMSIPDLDTSQSKITQYMKTRKFELDLIGSGFLPCGLKLEVFTSFEDGNSEESSILVVDTNTASLFTETRIEFIVTPHDVANLSTKSEWKVRLLKGDSLIASQSLVLREAPRSMLWLIPVIVVVVVVIVGVIVALLLIWRCRSKTPAEKNDAKIENADDTTTTKMKDADCDKAETESAVEPAINVSDLPSGSDGEKTKKAESSPERKI